MMKFSTYNEFKKEVLNLLKSRLGVKAGDIDENSLRDSFESGWLPSDHVDLVTASI